MIHTHHLDLLLDGAWHPDLHPFCLRCGYDLTGSVSDRCPECGGPFNRREIEREAYALKTRIRQLGITSGIVRSGCYVGLIGMVIVVPTLPFNLLGSLGQSFGRVLACLFGVSAVLMGAGVAQVYRLPPWARGKLRPPPSPGMAFGSVSLGLALLAIAWLT